MTFKSFNGTFTLRFDAFASSSQKPLLLAAIGENKRGCYVYLDTNDNPLWVGKSKDLQSRLKNHDIEKQLPTPYYIGVIFTNDDHLEEQNLIASLQPKFNKLSK
jgi:hypothetical protein